MYKNQEWDYYYIIRMLEKRLTEYHKYFDNPKNVYVIEKSRKHKVKRMLETLGHLRKYMDSNYTNCREWEAMDKLFGKHEMTPISEGYSTLERSKVKTDKDKKIERILSRKLLKTMMDREEHDWKMIWVLISKHMRGWWD